VKDSLAENSEPVYPDVLKVLGFKEPTDCRELWHHPGATLALNNTDSHRKPRPSRPLWRKRETIVHERIVQYTTVDVDGVVQELIESERTQNEIVHLECKDTGEFAHRESTQYEQMETFNSEVVAQERGAEEYLHLKSRDDEFEHLQSDMPRTKRAEEEAAKASAQAAEAADALGQEQHPEDNVDATRWWAAQKDGGKATSPVAEDDRDMVGSWKSPNGEDAQGEFNGWWAAQAGDETAPPDPRRHTWAFSDNVKDADSDAYVVHSPVPPVPPIPE
jgi:hypothetical protein